MPQPDGPMKAVTRLVPSVEVDALQRMVFAIVEVQVARGDLRRAPREAVRGSRSAGALTETERSLISGPLGAENAGANIQGKYGQGDEQGTAPGELLPVFVGALHEVVDGHRQVGHGLGQVEAEELVGERGEQQRRGFAGNARGRQQHAGDEAGARGAVGDPLDDQRARQPQRACRLAQRIGHQQQHVFGGAQHDGNDDHGQRQRTGDGREVAHRHHHRAVDEQADDDRGRAQQNVVDEADHRGQAVVPAVFSEIGAGEQPERRADADADHGHDDRTDDRVQQAALGRSRRRRILGEDLQAECP